MTEFIKNKDDFSKNYKSKLAKYFKDNVAFEDNPFNTSYKIFLACEYDFIYHKHFFEGLKVFLNQIQYSRLVFYTIDPSPEEYFYKHFKKYSVFEIGINESENDLNEIMMKNPGDSEADALAIRSDIITWFSDSTDWAILASRDFELAIVGFTSSTIKEIFTQSFSEGTEIFSTVKDQVEVLNETNFSSPKELYNKLIRNYNI